MSHDVFVYGTLRKGLHNHEVLHGAKFVRMARAKGRLIGLGSFPALLPGDEQVVGEIYRVDDAMLARLDQLEGHPYFYRRETADVQFESRNGRVLTRQVAVYVFQRGDRFGTPVPKTTDGAYDWMLEIDRRNA